MSDQQRRIYQAEGDRYEALVSHEDHQGNIIKALNEIVAPSGLDILDLGAGTGRLTLLLAPRAKFIHAFDVSEEMLRVCRQRLEAGGFSNWRAETADHRHLPVHDHSADLVVSGWSVSYLAVWNPEHWRAELETWFDEMMRVLRPKGFVVLFESLGTGNEAPVKLEHLADYYPWLDEKGFQNKWIRTDYRFDSLEEAVELSGFFFGEELAERIRQKKMIILPECTGVWWKQIS